MSGARLSADFDPVVQRPCHQGVLGCLFLPPGDIICHITHIPGCTARLFSMPSHPSSVPRRLQGFKGAAATHNSLVHEASQALLAAGLSVRCALGVHAT